MARVFVLGLDGATLDLIQPWVDEGKLPHFKKLMRHGVYGRLESVPNMRSAAAWTSFMTGKNPGKHGIFEFYEHVPQDYSLRFINASLRDAPSLWGILSRKEKRVAAINVPMTYPAEKVNGICISGLDAPGSASKNFTHPADLLQELEQKFGRYIIEPGLSGYVIGGKIDRAVEALKKELDQKVKITQYLYQKGEWDFFMVVLRSLDAVQHLFWKYMDPSHPDYKASEAKKYGRIIFDTYLFIDQAMGEILKTVHEDTLFMVMSDHGFGAKHPASNQLNQWLASIGMLQFEKGFKTFTTKMLGVLYRSMVGATPRRTKEVLAKIFPGIRDRVQSRLCLQNINWNKTRAYSDTLFPTIRVNLQGREGMGAVSQQAVHAVIEEIVQRLKECRDSKSGEKIVERVLRKEEIYHGKYMDSAPDLLIQWREDIPIHGIHIERKPGDRQNPERPFIPGEDYRVISGDHRRHGILFAYGNKVQADQQIQGANLMDLAPTILYAMGQAVPDDMDGKVLEEVFTPEVLEAHPPVYEPAKQELHEREGGGYDHEEAEEISERLKGLGYLE